MMIENNPNPLQKTFPSSGILKRSRFGTFFSFVILVWFAFLPDGSARAESAPENILPSTESIPAYQSRFGRKRPVIAIVGDNEYTELSDYIVPYGILKEAGVAEVFALSTLPGNIQMFPALQIESQNTISQFDAMFPDGADYVIVPAIHNSENSNLRGWVQAQSSKGATVLGICDGVWVLANAGLLKGHAATGHWFSLDTLEKKFSDTKWIRNRRYVVDRNIITTTGVTASIPVSLALVEAISGKQAAASVALKFGQKDWAPTHTSSRFKLDTRSIWTAAKNLLAFWSYEEIGVSVYQGTDELTLALVADAYSRTYKTKVFSFSEDKGPVRTKRGLVLIPDKIKGSSNLPDRLLGKIDDQPAVPTLDQTLRNIESLYGSGTADFVALQMEYARK